MKNKLNYINASISILKHLTKYSFVNNSGEIGIEYYNGQIVVSSTWRYDHSLEQLKSLFEENGLPPHFVVDATPPLIHYTPGPVTRGDEIRAWIDENLEQKQIQFQRYIILDDVDDGLTPFGDRFIQCDPKTGFADKEKVKRIVGLV